MFKQLRMWLINKLIGNDLVIYANCQLKETIHIPDSEKTYVFNNVDLNINDKAKNGK